MPYRVLFSALIIGYAVCLVPAGSEAFSITPGKWQFDYENTSPFSPQPQKKTETQCVKETDWDPVKSMSDSGHCQVSNVKHDSSSFSGNVTCARGKGNAPMTGSMQYTSTNTAMTGHTAFKGEGYDMEMKTNGKRLGECD
jgi:hypothetical protein